MHRQGRVSSDTWSTSGQQVCRVCVYKVNVHSGQHIGWAISSRLEQQSIKPNEAAELRFGTEAQAPPARRHTNTLVCVFFVFCLSLYTPSPATRVDKCVPTILLRQKKEKKKDSSHSSPEAMFFSRFCSVLRWGVREEVSSPSPQISHALQS